VRDGEDGYFVECGDIKGLVQKLRIVLGSIATTEKLGKVGQQRYRNLFTATQTAHAFGDIYIKLLSPKTQRKLSRELTANSKIE
jgi:glycosyltransferase involved in cell wall biosynthesis